jgi:hypothetical protein
VGDGIPPSRQQLLREAAGHRSRATDLPTCQRNPVRRHAQRRHAFRPPLPVAAPAELADELLATIQSNAADALHRCHQTLEYDGHAHRYTAEEWLPVIYDAAAPRLESSRLDQEPPSLVRQTQEAMRWLSTSIACLDEDSRETPAALADTLARLLVVWVFADAACTRSE